MMGFKYDLSALALGPLCTNHIPNLPVPFAFLPFASYEPLSFVPRGFRFF